MPRARTVGSKNGVRHRKNVENGELLFREPEELPPQLGDSFFREKSHLYFSPAEKLYDSWPSPVCIVCDGPYGINGFPGDEYRADTLTSHSITPHWTQRMMSSAQRAGSCLQLARMAASISFSVWSASTWETGWGMNIRSNGRG